MSDSKPISKQAMLEVLEQTPAERLPLPEAYTDPAFNKCMVEACGSPELIANFDRLTGCKLGRIGSGSVIERMVDKASGFQDDQMRQFVEFVHSHVYMTLPQAAIHALRLTQ